MKQLVEIHIIQNFAPSNLNRDDTGAPKDAIFGGYRRARVSSQCQKRAVRRFFNALLERGILNREDVGVRTRRVLSGLCDSLVDKHGRERGEAENKAEATLGALDLKINRKEDGPGLTEYLLFLAPREIDDIAGLINRFWDEISVAVPTSPPAPGEEPPKKGKGKKEARDRMPPSLAKEMEKLLTGGKALDVALFGRMLADMPQGNQNAACQVAHAISTHMIEREFDFFTAMDDWQPDGEAGAGMMGTVEFNAACLYRYAAVDCGLLTRNLNDDAGLAKTAVRAFVEGFVVAEPTGKQNTFAAHNPPEFVVVSVRKDAAPWNLANAFETPMSPSLTGGLTRLSAEALVVKAARLAKAYGAVGADSFVLNLCDADCGGFGVEMESLPGLLDAVMARLEV